MCFGCTACMNICPVKAISMKEDDEGFIMPVIDQNVCTDCGACRNTCPALHPDYSNDMPGRVYGFAADKKTLKKSSSGGAFTLLAEEILGRSGTVFGAAYKDDFSVHHVAVTDIADLDSIRRSKYSQSDQEDCYTQAKALLEKGKPVLYSGTPCQIAGLNAFLGIHNGKEYPGLVTCELICHGIPSPKFHQEHLKELSGGNRITSVEMRSRKGWGTCYLVTTDTGETFGSKNARDIYLNAFLSHLIMRRSCHGCAFAKLPRQADITIGDLWDAKRLELGEPYEQKSSIVLLNTETGTSLWEKALGMSGNTPSTVNGGSTFKAKSGARVAITDLSTIDIKTLNHNITRPSADEDMSLRESFYENVKHMSFEQAVIRTLYNYDTGLVLHMGNNYGSIATGYALYKAIENMGFSPVMLDSVVAPRGEVAREFVKRHMDLSSKCIPKDNAKAADMLCENFVLGSDQSLNWDFIYNMKHLEYMLLGFTSPEKRRISYASSFGSPRESMDDRNIQKGYAALLGRFDAFSVRETYALEMSKRLFHRDADLTADPVFLLDKEDWLDIASCGKAPQGKYLLAYILENSPAKEALIEMQAKKYGLEPFIITDIATYSGTGKQVTPEDWIACFANADRVITDSFHGTCFSLIFEKPFLTVKARQTERFDSLAEQLGLDEKTIGRLFLDQDSPINPKGDYFKMSGAKDLGGKLSDYSKKSREWLHRALTIDKNKETQNHADASPDLLIDYVRLLKQEMSLDRMMREGRLIAQKGLEIDIISTKGGSVPEMPESVSEMADVKPLSEKTGEEGFSVMPGFCESIDIVFDLPGGGDFDIRISNRDIKDSDGGARNTLIHCGSIYVDGSRIPKSEFFVSPDKAKTFHASASSGKEITVRIDFPADPNKDMDAERKNAMGSGESSGSDAGKSEKSGKSGSLLGKLFGKISG